MTLLFLCSMSFLWIMGGEPSKIYQTLNYRLHLGGHSFDPLYDSNGQPEAWQGGLTGRHDLQLVQFHGPATPADLDQLKAAGFDPVSYIFPLTYVVWGRGHTLHQLNANEKVRWTGPFAPGYRLLPMFRGPEASTVSFRALVYRGAKKQVIQAEITRMGAEAIREFPINKRLLIYQFNAPGNALAEMAQIPGVLSLQPVPRQGGVRGEMSAQHMAGERDLNGMIQPGYAAWLNLQGLSGQGVIMAIVDDGIDANHPDFSLRELPCVGDACAGAMTSTHGTQVAGNILGDGSSLAQDANGFLRGLGVAPEASFLDFLQSEHQNPGGVLDLMTQSVRNGAVLSNNSWGVSPQALGYDMDTMMVDVGVRDADPDMIGSQSLTYVLAINNGGGQFQSQGTPDEAKNIIAVGATKLQTTLGEQDVDLDDLASVTAHGPARDGRMLPHLVGPGCRVDGPTLGNAHLLRCGTSFAAPQVAGAAALFIETYREKQSAKQGIAEPSPAMVKAAVMASTVDLEGRKDAAGSSLDHRPDSKQGWGRLQLAPLLDPALTKAYYDEPIIFQASGEQWDIPLEVVDTNLPASLTLVWTDAPGHGLGGATPAWNNDLNLEVDYQGQLYIGNQVGPSGWSIPGGMADFQNNAEGIWLGPLATGSVDVRVVASNLAWDGVPDQVGLMDQDFALVATNLKERTTFRIEKPQNNPRFCTPGGTTLNIVFRSFGGFSENVDLSISGLPPNMSAQFSQTPIVPPSEHQLNFQTMGPVSAGSFPIQVTAVSASVTQTLDLILEVYEQQPAEVVLSSPSPFSSDISLEPSFSWLASGDAASYEFHLALDENFTQMVGNQVTAEGGVLWAEALASFTRYFWRVRAVNPCGDGDWSETRRFRTRLVPPILLVDDDGDAPDVKLLYVEALESLGQLYDVWETQNSTNEPTAEDLQRYQMVIWFSGAATNFSDPKAGPSAVGELALATYLEGGGCLLLSSQEYLYDRGGPSHNVPNAFMQTYLGLDTGESDVDHTTVTGVGALFGDIETQNLTHVFPNQSDRLSPDKNSDPAFEGNLGDAAVSKQTETYQTHYFGFSLTALSEAVRQEVLTAILGACPPVLPGGCLSSGDLLNQATNWPTVSIQDLLSCLDQYSGKL